jgi:putative selenate reductase
VTVKLNPTLLGKERVDHLLHDVMGYHDVQTRAQDFEKDLQWEQALEITDRLSELARSRGRTFQVKFSNTLVVRNHRQFFPASEEVMYLSGEPLHVVTLNLVEQYRRARPQVPISFSAGVDNRNFADCAALGFTPITTCTDLLRPGGYARLPKYLENLEARMRALGVRTLGDYVVKACGQGEQAIAAVIDEPPLRQAALLSLGGGAVALREELEKAGAGALYPRLVRQAALLNTPVVVARVTADPRFRQEQNNKAPRKIGSKLWLFDCINCDKCVPVCPNDANFVYETGLHRAEYSNYALQQGQVVEVPGGLFEVKKEHQIANFQDFCNECGNCDVFCPEDGGPYIEKPRFFGSLDAWRRLPRDGFYCLRQDDVDAAWLRLRGVEYHLEVDRTRDRALFTDGAIRLELRHSERRALQSSARQGTAEGHTLDFAAYLNMALAVDGVLDGRRSNPVNSAHP